MVNFILHKFHINKLFKKFFDAVFPCYKSSLKLRSVIPATQEAEIGKIMVQGQSRQKLCKTPPPNSVNKLDVVSCACDPRYKDCGQADPGQKCKTLPEKQLKHRRAGYVV
jgi:hypothetical protein